MKEQAILYESPQIMVARCNTRKSILDSSTFSGSTTGLDEESYGGFSGDTPEMGDDNQ